jgi:hypothetical protein
VFDFRGADGEKARFISAVQSDAIGPLRQLLQRKRMSAFTVTAEVTGARSIRRFLTHDVTSPPSNTALRKDYSITSSERATNLGIQPIVNR